MNIQKFFYASLCLFSIAYSEQIQSIALLGEDCDPKEYVKGIQTYGLDLPSEFRVLNIYLREFLGCEVSDEIIESIQHKIFLYYDQFSHPFVIVVPLQQEGDVVKFLVKESHIGEVEIIGNCHFNPCIVEDLISICPGDEIDVRCIAQDLYWINKNPFMDAYVYFEPGSEEMTTNVTYSIHDRRTFRIYAGGDNTGFASTGMGRFYAGFNWGDVWNLGHIMTFQVTESSKFDRYRSFTGSYAMPFLGKNRLLFYGGYSRFRPEMTIPQMKNEGYNYQVSGRYTFPLSPRYPDYVHDLSIGIDVKKTNTNLTFNEQLLIGNSTLITQACLNYFGVYECGNLKFPVEFNAYYMPGNLFPDQSNADFQSLRYKARNRYFYVNFSSEPYYCLPHDFGLSLNLKAQLSTTNLLSSEQFGLGGYGTVRGYEYREANTDNGIVASVEALSPAIIECSIRAVAFVDFGMGWDHIRTPSIDDPVYLLGAGGGLRCIVDPYLYFRVNLGYGFLKTDYDRKARRFQWDIGAMVSY